MRDLDTFEQLVDEMHDLIDRAMPVPLNSRKVMVDAEAMRALLNDIRLNLPPEVKRAKQVLYDQKGIIADAESRANEIIRKAELQARHLIQNHVIVQEATNRAVDIDTKAKEHARMLKVAVDNYCKKSISDIEHSLMHSLNTLRETRQKLETRQIRVEQTPHANNQQNPHAHGEPPQQPHQPYQPQQPPYDHQQPPPQQPSQPQPRQNPYNSQNDEY
jgi:vacuolar-type H+-ATPase subunit H